MMRFKAMRYAVWNNKGGVGKSFLTFVLATEVAKATPSRHVIVVDMCPQANLSEIVLGGNGAGARHLDRIISAPDRRTVGGYFDARITSPHQMTGTETSYMVQARQHNKNLPPNLWLIVGDPSLEIQAQVISQIGGQTLPADAWRNVHNWLKDLVSNCSAQVGGGDAAVFIDCNPSFSAYTELAMMASERLIIPCSSDGSSARAIDNIGSLLYGVGNDDKYGDVTFRAKAQRFNMPLPVIHSVILNRSTQYNDKASKAFGAMFGEIKKRTRELWRADPRRFISAGQNGRFLFHEIPDNHSVAIVCSHLGRPLYSIGPGKYGVHETTPQVNSEPLDRYKSAVQKFLTAI